MALRVLPRIALEHGLGHAVHAQHEVRRGEEGLVVHRDVVVQGRNHVVEVVEPVTLEHRVHHLEHLPHVLADVLGGEVAGEEHRLLVEFDDGVGEDVVDGPARENQYHDQHDYCIAATFQKGQKRGIFVEIKGQ